MMARPRTKVSAFRLPGVAWAETRVGALQSREIARSALATALASKNLLSEAEALLQLGRIFTPSVEPQATLDAVTRAEQIFIANSAPVQAARCRIAAARATLDLGQDRDAIERAKRALAEPSLPPEHRVAGFIVMAQCHAHFGRLDAATNLLLGSAAPLAEQAGSECRIHVRKTLAIVQFQMLLAVDFPHLHRGLAFVGGAGTERPGSRQIHELLDTIEAELPAGTNWPQIEIIRHLTLGLCDPGSKAIERLAALADASVSVDPPAAAWALYAQSLVHRNRRDLELAQESVDRCLAITEQWGLKAISRYPYLQQSLIRESIEDYSGSLEAYKIFSALRLRSVTANVDAPEQIVTAKPLAEARDGLTAAALMRPLESRHVKRAIRFIESNLSVPISVGDIAAECQVSRRTLEVAFKSSKSCTLANYVKRRRLETAAGLLRFSALLVSEVASSVGYRWPSAFARDFVSHYGIRPSDWRARHMEEAGAESSTAL